MLLRHLHLPPLLLRRQHSHSFRRYPWAYRILQEVHIEE